MTIHRSTHPTDGLAGDVLKLTSLVGELETRIVTSRSSAKNLFEAAVAELTETS